MGIAAVYQYSVAVLVTLVVAPAAYVLASLGLHRAAYSQVRAFAWAAHAFTGVRSRAQGLSKIPKVGSYVVVSNHNSHLDAPALVRRLPHPLYFIIKRELARIPIWGNAAVKLGFIAVDRGRTERARAQMRQAIETIRSGRRVLVFAEGTRSEDGRLQPFKKGGFHLAIDAQVPILPVAINGSYTLLPKGQPAARPGVVDVIVCDPISTTGLGKKDLPELVARTREAILEARRLDPDFIE